MSMIHAGQVLAARASMPAPEHYAPLMALLVDTVRGTIAECAEAAYDSLSIAAARDMLMLDSEADLRAFLARAHPDWSLEGDRIVFVSTNEPKSEKIPALRLISESLTYATELERIV